MSSSLAPLSASEGSGSVSGAPNLHAGFTDTFTSRYIDAGEIRLHAVIGGEGPPLLVHGWRSRPGPSPMAASRTCSAKLGVSSGNPVDRALPNEPLGSSNLCRHRQGQARASPLDYQRPDPGIRLVIDSIDRAARILVAYYSATGRVHALAKAVAEGAEAAGAEVRLRPVEELAPEQVISRNQASGRHRSEVTDEPTASLDDLEWADGIAFGTPTRFGNVAAQLKMFLEQAGQLWQEGKLINKVATAFTSSQTVHGGQESTILAPNNTFYHWGAIVLPLGYTVSEVFNGGGNSYGASYTSGTRVGPPDRETTVVAFAQGRRLAPVAQVIGVAREHGLLDMRAGVLAERHDSEG